MATNKRRMLPFRQCVTKLITCLFMALAAPALAQQPTTDTTGLVSPPPKPEPEKKWFDNISLRGYAQVRYNRLLETNSDLKCEQCDRSWGDNGGFFIRRMRLISAWRSSGNSTTNTARISVNSGHPASAAKISRWAMCLAACI